MFYITVGNCHERQSFGPFDTREEVNLAASVAQTLIASFDYLINNAANIEVVGHKITLPEMTEIPSEPRDKVYVDNDVASVKTSEVW